MVTNSWTEIIKEIRGKFYDKGITDDLAILESLGFFLLAAFKEVIVENESPFEVNLEKTHDRLIQLFPYSELPHPPSFRGKTVDRKLFSKTIVHSISYVNINKLGSFYEDTIKYLITEMKTGGRYTTPRHITRFMGDIAGLNPDCSFVDFACGSGGILLNAEKYNVRQVIGYEISPNWARIATTNLILHGIENNSIIIGDSFNDVPEDSQFDAIVMNPPFGMKTNKNVRSSSRFGEYASQSEIAFLQLGLDNLSKQGTLITLLPSGFLFSTGKQNEILKKHLIHNYLLRSVVTFPDDAFQPYSNIQTHLLEIQNEKVPSDDNLIWFYHPRYDGFTPGRNRKEDHDHNDLPFIRDVMILHKSRENNKKKSALFSVDSLNSDGNQGYRIAIGPQASIFEWESKNKKNLLSSARYGLSTNKISFIFKHKDKEEDFITAFFNGEKFQTEGDPLSQIKLSKVFSQKLPKNGLQINHENLKNYFISPEGIKKKNQVIAQLKPHHSELTHQNIGNFCFLFQPDIGYFSKQMLIENTEWLPDELKPPCILPVEDAEQEVNQDSTFYLAIWDDTKPNGFPIMGTGGTKGYFRSLTSGEDLLMVQREQQADDYYFIFFDRKSLKKLPENAEGVVIDHEGFILGVGVSKEVIVKKRYDLMPSTYIPEEKEIKEVLLPPAYILGNIKKDQIDLTIALDNLLQIVEKKLPYDNLAKLPQFPLLNYIDQDLKTKWDNLPQNYFQLSELDDITIEQQALDLLVSLGLLLHVELGDGIYYRRVENNDVQGREPHED